jgi:hypothetical protein
MSVQIDPASYIRFPKLDVAGALSLAKILLHRVPKSTSPAVRKAASLVEGSVEELETKWTQQGVPVVRHDLRPLARRVGVAWKAIRDRLVGFEALPEGNADRTQAILLRDTLFADGLEFNLISFARHHAESEHRLRLLDEVGLAKDLVRLVGDHFVKMLRAAHQAYGDALGINMAAPQAVAVLLSEPLRALADAITGYALQLVALARHEPEKRDAIVRALSPIDEFRASLGRRVVSDVDDEDAANDDPEIEAPPIADETEEPQPTGTE